MKISILLLTYTFPPVLRSGGSLYYKVLWDELKKKKEIERVVVLTEHADGWRPVYKEGNFLIFRLLLPRAPRGGTKRRGFLKRVFVHSFNQLILLASVPLLTVLFRNKIIHVHASLFALTKKSGFNNIPFFCLLIFLRKLLAVKVLVDVRGISKCFPQFKSFDKILCCSHAIYDRCREIGIPVEKCKLIPVPLYLPPLESDKTDNMGEYNPFICFVGNLTEQKGVFELIEAFKMLKGYGDLRLVLVGVNGEGSRLIDKIEKSQKIHYLGPKTQADVISIVSQAELFILPSKSEGLPRSCLEAMAVGTKVLLPPRICEFEQHCPEYVLPSIEPNVIKDKIIWAVEYGRPVNYPIREHEPHLVVEQIVQTYRELSENC